MELLTHWILSVVAALVASIILVKSCRLLFSIVLVLLTMVIASILV